MEPLYSLTATALRKKVLNRETTAKEITASCIARIQETDAKLKAWVYFDPAIAMRQAEKVDAQIDQDPYFKRLAGVPVGVKDIFNTADFPTSMGSPIWKDFTPGNDARILHYIREAGGVIPGKTTTAEFAVHAPAETVNPHNPAYSPGTSSSGSAAAVAACQVPLALGTQTAGSIIRPASYCGVFGYKPSFGLIPRTGALKTTDTLDTVGMFGRCIDDLHLLFDILRVHGENFPYIHEFLENPKWQEKPKNDAWKILLVTDNLWVWENADPYAKTAIQDLAKQLSGQGMTVETAKLPAAFKEAHKIHSVIYDKTLAYYFRDEFKKHTLISKIMYEIISRGQNINLEQYQKALADQTALKKELEENIFAKYDAIITLSTSGEAPKFGGDDKPDSALIWTLCHVPSISIPVFKSPNQMPFGLQIVGPRYRDYRLFELGRKIESLFASSLTTRHPAGSSQLATR